MNYLMRYLSFEKYLKTQMRTKYIVYTLFELRHYTLRLNREKRLLFAQFICILQH